ncbi:Hypothetical protein YALI2_F00280g [Yarrowia lipolytica]|nr:Hypothetical protein YALI2_F00280g [Yarrowia lipolytica]
MRVLQELPQEVENRENCDPTVTTPMPRILAGLKRLVGAETVAVHAEVHKQQSSADTEPSAYSKVSSVLVNPDSSPGTSVQSRDPNDKLFRDFERHTRAGAADIISIPSFTLVTAVDQLGARVPTKPGQGVTYQLKLSTCITVPEFPRVQTYIAIFIDNSASMSPTDFSRAIETAGRLYDSASALYPRLYVFNDHPRHVRIEHLHDTTQSTSAERDITGACLQVGLVIEPLRNLRVSFESNGWEPIEDELIPCFYPGMYLERTVHYVLGMLPGDHVAQAPDGNNLGAVESLEAALGIYLIQTGLLTVSYEMSGVEGLIRREHPLYTKRFEFDDELEPRGTQPSECH